MKVLFTLLLGCILLCPSLWASAPAENGTLNLEQAISNTLNNNPYLQGLPWARETRKAQRNQAALTPGYQLNVELENLAGSGNARGTDQAELTVALSSVLELGGKRNARVRVADAQSAHLQAQQQTETLDVLGDLTQAFIRALTTAQEITLAQESVEISRYLVSAVSRRADQGGASDAELGRARAQLAQARIHLANLVHQQTRQHMALAAFWGASEPDFKHVQGNLFGFKSPASLEQLFQQAQASPLVSALASEARLKHAEVQLAEAANRADLGWRVGIRHENGPGDQSLVAGISLPLLSADRNRASVAAAKARQQQTAFTREDTLVRLRRQLFSALSLYRQHLETYRQLNAMVIPNLEQALKTTRESYDSGLSNYQDWITAQQELLGAKQQRINNAAAVLTNQSVIETLIAQPLAHTNGTTNQ